MTKQAPEYTHRSTYLKFEKIYFSIAAVSVMLVVWQYFGMNRLVEVYPSNAEVSVSGDFLNGGHSEGLLNVTDDGALLNCKIKPSPTFAYCSLDITIGDGINKGLDVSQFRQLNLWLDHATTNQDTVLVFLKNREHISENVDPSSRNSSNKSNHQTILPKVGSHYYSLSLSQFTVPSWWILLHKATGVVAKPSLDNVVGLRIATGDSLELRNVQIQLKRATLSGKWVSANLLYSLLAIFWAFVITLHAGFRVYQLANQLQIKRSQNISLEKLNCFLSIQKDEFEVLAKTDSLTGVSNRAGTRDLFEHMQSHYDGVYSLIMFDIDHFKVVNDTYGHQLGDEVLRDLSKLVVSLIRNTDHFARWGGEEFIVICPDTKMKEAVVMANHLRENIAVAIFNGGVSVTCSFGLSKYQKKGKNTIQKMFEAADAAMYKAKEKGSNRIEY
ncbi:MAG: diguanylate cyclase (GGDEF)-like protein [Paraglaciecola sp.]|jgi:diguanylate cyclase (GGDEF)-like protein